MSNPGPAPVENEEDDLIFDLDLEKEVNEENGHSLEKTEGQNENSQENHDHNNQPQENNKDEIDTSHFDLLDCILKFEPSNAGDDNNEGKRFLNLFSMGDELRPHEYNEFKDLNNNFIFGEEGDKFQEEDNVTQFNFQDEKNWNNWNNENNENMNNENIENNEMDIEGGVRKKPRR